MSIYSHGYHLDRHFQGEEGKYYIIEYLDEKDTFVYFMVNWISFNFYVIKLRNKLNSLTKKN